MIVGVDPGQDGAMAAKLGKQVSIRSTGEHWSTWFRTGPNDTVFIEQQVPRGRGDKILINYGRLLQYFEQSGAEVHIVPPQRWQHALQFPLGLDYSKRKTHGHELAKQHFSHLLHAPIKKPHADALLLLHYGTLRLAAA